MFERYFGPCGKYQNPKVAVDFKNKNITFKHGIAFKKNRAIYFEPHRLEDPEMYLVVDKGAPKKLMPESNLFWGDQNTLLTYR
jgi:hypothetical protein